MRCPFCGDQESKVVDSRHSEDGLSIRRRRECSRCQHRFTTYEMVENLPVLVVKRNGSRQNFDKNKIVNSMLRAFDNDVKFAIKQAEKVYETTPVIEDTDSLTVIYVLGESYNKHHASLYGYHTLTTPCMGRRKD